MSSPGATHATRAEIAFTHAVGPYVTGTEGACDGIVDGSPISSAHSVQHWQPCASQSTLMTSRLRSLQTSLGNSPDKSLSPIYKASRFSKLLRSKGIAPVIMLLFNDNAARIRSSGLVNYSISIPVLLPLSLTESLRKGSYFTWN